MTTSTPPAGGPVPRPGDPRAGAPRPGDPRPAPERPVSSLRAGVDEAMAGLDGLSERPVGEHVAAFERVHTALGEALTAGSERA
ncbi:hypothetical protein EV383_2390 [Pseudonocardia sediminis]|uniref:Uncharacterized protein n=1 Tax=Pseudonocardia sediminis TaxID=1397368 RepID=A0A4V2FQQ3_PSEST|nr:hypothetical protein [Pseudonocardia sediminis]RZT85520.1 hypothetical protein EV383_2390 [Pseudonocardia sediminis]